MPMPYRVLARAYRSRTFEEVVGQETIATTLKNAIQAGRVHHGYLFTGTRGVGKTTMARILAKSLNCLAIDTPTVAPCCECDSCRSIAEGEDIDVIEIDAASNTGVDNIRDLRNNASLRPSRSRFRIYIIDEVHMLSTGAFNALLKTLEEPPPHVKFILATTEAHKVPATIQSRCQRFDFRAVDVVTIASHLKRIIDAEKVVVDDAVLRRISRLANGSVRDALSLLERLVSFAPDGLNLNVINEVLPPPHDELAFALFSDVAERNPAGALQKLDQALQSGRTVERFCEHLIEHVRSLMLLRVCGPETDLVDASGVMRKSLVDKAERFDAPTYVYMITLLEELRRTIKFSGAARALAEAAIVRLAMSHQFSGISELLAELRDRKSSETGNRPPTTAVAKGLTQKVPTETPKTVNASRQGALSRSSQGPLRAPPTEARSSPGPRRSVSSAEKERILDDPLVQRIREAVEGTVVDVRPGPTDSPRATEPSLLPHESEDPL
jgi:DNA polymerase-3 subunit gamma/tau